ncbi:hypothetical protein B296_00058722 [Ensete ventricosum]|uniref:Uncharacterized protein n=1 Tax=Ensete ventricosum TaxID=4639 RepID=A0A426XGB8_ENSVE|nr:hypothetical protein B296_00058722 [Ensete ventricosum]
MAKPLVGAIRLPARVASRGKPFVGATTSLSGPLQWGGLRPRAHASKFVPTRKDHTYEHSRVYSGYGGGRKNNGNKGYGFFGDKRMIIPLKI